MKPCIFISAVTSELKTARQLMANELTRLGYDPVWEDIFGSEPGDLLQVLRDKIDGCDGLIHLVGRAYGSEPTEPDPEFGRVSYTQFEFLYGDKKWPNLKDRATWLIFVGDGCTRDTPLEQLDLAHDPVHPDPAGYQAERRALQDDWRTRLEKGSHLWHPAANDDQLKLRVNELRDDFAKLREKFETWQQDVARNQSEVKRGTSWTLRTLVVVLLFVAVISGGVWWTVFRQPGQVRNAIAEELAALKPDDIKTQLRRTIEETHLRQLQEAEKLTAFDKRDEAKKSAAEMRERRLGKVDEFLKSITSTIQSGEASPEFLELTRVIQEEGVDRALAYIASKEWRLLDEAEHLTQQKRRKLSPLLEGVRLHLTKNELDPALALCEKLLKEDGDWPDLLHE